MKAINLLFITLIFVNFGHVNSALFSWLFKDNKKKEAKDGQPPAPSDTAPLGSTDPTSNERDVNVDVSLAVSIPFEARTSDEKFLMEAEKLTSLQLSELDKCQHKVILSLQTSCNHLTNEELSKVAVNLFNCQSYAEGRQVYPCSLDMSLEECTKNMDPNTWNAYHIISNRVRAVCYASRQEQFRAKTEMTVNKLMSSSEAQIKSMNYLQESQEELGKATSKTIETLSDGHEVLQKQQSQLSSAQHTIQSYVSSNLRELHKEKRIIAAGQKDLALITEAIKRKLDEARKQLEVQEENQRGAHSHILSDLSEIQDDARRVWEKLDASTSNILQKHEETIQQFGRLTQDLREMNYTVHHLMDAFYAVENKVSWISTLVGGTDSTVQKVYSCVLHLGYFLMSMLAASFLQVPYLTRVVLVVLVPLNALSEIKNDNSLNFSTLTTLLALCVLANLLFSLFVGFYRKKEGYSYVKDAVRQYLRYEMQDYSSTAVVNLNGSKFMSDLNATNKQLTSTPPSSRKSNVPPSSRKDDDYSSDEEVMLTPVPKAKESSFLRRRVLEDSRDKSFLNSSVVSQPINETSFIEGSGSAVKHNLQPINESSFVEGSVSTVNNNFLLSAVDVVNGPIVFQICRGRLGVALSLYILFNTSGTTNFSPKYTYTNWKEKPLSSVRRHLLDQLENSHLAFQASVGRRSNRSTPMRGTPSSSRSGTPSRSLTPKRLCDAVCKNGQLCRNAATAETSYCRRHGISNALS